MKNPFLEALIKAGNEQGLFEDWLSSLDMSSGINDFIGFHEGDYDPDDYDSKKEYEEAMEENRNEKFEDYFQEKSQEFITEFGKISKIQNGGLKIFRCVTVADAKKYAADLKKGKYPKGFSGLGIFWSWDESAAECHWGDSKHPDTIVLEAVAPLNAVDFKTTVIKNLHTSMGDEKEIQLKEGAKIKLLSIEDESRETIEKFKSPLQLQAEKEPNKKEELKEKYGEKENTYLYFPVSINGEDDFHLTVKFLGKSLATKEELLKALEDVDTTPPENFQWEAVTFDSKNDGDVKVLELTEFPDNLQDLHDAFGEFREDDYDSYRPHITVEDSLWKKIEADEIQPDKALVTVGPLMVDIKGEKLVLGKDKKTQAAGWYTWESESPYDHQPWELPLQNTGGPFMGAPGATFIKQEDVFDVRLNKDGANASVTAETYEDEGHVGEHWGTQASGIMFICDGKVLLLKRADWTMDPGLWGIAGGAVPIDKAGQPKDVKQSAMDEVSEEMGGLPPHTDTGKSSVYQTEDGFKYTTFVFEVPETFEPILNSEHERAQWFPLDELPEDIHPGVMWSLNQLGLSKKSESSEVEAAKKEGKKLTVPPEIRSYIRGDGPIVEIDESEVKAYHKAIQPFLKKLYPAGKVKVYRAQKIYWQREDEDQTANSCPPELACSFSTSKQFAFNLAAEKYDEQKDSDADDETVMVIELEAPLDRIYFHHDLDPIGKEHPNEKEVIVNAAGLPTKVIKAYKHGSISSAWEPFTMEGDLQRGWISPTGEWYPTDDISNHAETIKKLLYPQSKEETHHGFVEEAYEKGWISIGHAGSSTVSASSKTLLDRKLPAIATLKEMLKDDLTTEKVFVEGIGKPDFEADYYDKNIFIKHGTWKKMIKSSTVPESFLPEDLVMVDGEFTNVNPKRDHLLQVAMLKLKLKDGQYAEVDEPLVLHMEYKGEPTSDFHKEHLAHIFEKCNDSNLQPGEAKQQICKWLGELKGKVQPTGDCVHKDMAFLLEKGLIDDSDISIEGDPIPGTFHYENFEMHPLKTLARHKQGAKKDVAGVDKENEHDALVDCRNQLLELNDAIKVLVPDVMAPERLTHMDPANPVNAEVKPQKSGVVYPRISWIQDVMNQFGFDFEILDAFIVGSVAKGKEHEGSDLDILMIVPKKLEDSIESLNDNLVNVLGDEIVWEGKKVDFQVATENDPDWQIWYDRIPLKSSIEGATKELPEPLRPNVRDDRTLRDSHEAQLKSFEGKALRADDFQAFQELLSTVLVKLELTEDYRKSVAGVLNQFRERKGYVAL